MPRVQRGKGTAISTRCSQRGLFSFGTKREPERTAVPGGHESPSGAFKPQTGLRSKCRVFSAARARRFRRAGPTRKGLLAPFNPKEDGLHTKKLAASLNAFFALLRFEGPSAAAAAAPRRGAGVPSPSAPDGRSHLSQRERQEERPVCPWYPFEKETRNVPSTVLALPLTDSPGRGRWHEVPEGDKLARSA